MNTLPLRACLSCGKAIQGRIDKKFCDDYCRNAFNNQRTASNSKVIRNINNALKKNRNILAALLGDRDDTIKTTKQKLIEEGFQFKYLTHTYTNKKGNIYGYCYDHGYLKLDNDWFLIVRQKSV
ncbi:DUF2116 family Zn-ribbon domain-containing protein [Lunatimonas lonarensis]|uniref:DUF2116 family Zn-ribbon domain-containing protein n=1 Tax=Lunatimonas lonarensis TaxID=1232681 RepID=UPI0004AC5A0F|nr:DUF2116 family Zn-ribbon domain-containing protein [Lunatimonas lonarensis]